MGLKNELSFGGVHVTAVGRILDQRLSFLCQHLILSEILQQEREGKQVQNQLARFNLTGLKPV